jgi:hypothetical protein
VLYSPGLRWPEGLLAEQAERDQPFVSEKETEEGFSSKQGQDTEFAVEASEALLDRYYRTDGKAPA